MHTAFRRACRRAVTAGLMILATGLAWMTGTVPRPGAAAATSGALTVFAADKLSKARELRVSAGLEIKTRSRRLRNYRLCLRMLQERLPDSPLVSALAAELDSLPYARDMLAAPAA